MLHIDTLTKSRLVPCTEPCASAIYDPVTDYRSARLQTVTMPRQKKFPWLTRTRPRRRGLCFSVSRVHRHLRTANHSSRVSAGAAVYLAAVLQYLTNETFRIARNVAPRGDVITSHRVQCAIQMDEELSRLLSGVIIPTRLLTSGLPITRWALQLLKD